ncbi:HTH_Tnp_Tc3_2 domain-containing protein [Trichonephila clavipes]|nr:HTH_Tnp_Tc3_2 domain-containing protein [Trichonephila clavipes]
MEAGWSARPVTCQLGRSDCVVRRCGDQWIQEMSFTRGQGSGCPQQTSRREDHHIVKNSRVQPTASSTAIQAQVIPALGDPSRTIRRCLAEGHLGSQGQLRVLPLTPTPGLQFSGARSQRHTNPYSISAVMTNMIVCGDPVEEGINPVFVLQRHTAPTACVMVCGVPAYIAR